MANNTQLAKTADFKAFLNTKDWLVKTKAEFGGNKEKASTFLASILDLYEGDNYLQKCDPNNIVMECMKAASLDLPIVKALGFAYVLPYKNNKTGKYVATFLLGYKGLIQLAFRSGQIKTLNTDAVYEGETVVRDRISGTFTITGAGDMSKPIGYFAYMKLINGFEKMEYMTAEEVEAHAKKYSKAYKNGSGPWMDNFTEMAKKTLLRKVLKYAPMTTQMILKEKMEVAGEETKAIADAQEMMGSAGVIDVNATEIEPKQQSEGLEYTEPEFMEDPNPGF